MAERRASPHIPQGEHIPHADLVSRALDGDRAPWGTVAALHLGLCRTCRERLAAYERAAAAGRLTRPGETLQAPPARVWTSVRAHLAAERARTPSPPSEPAVHRAPNAGFRAPRRPAAAAWAVVRTLVRLPAHLLARLRHGRPRDGNR
ncbi:hypothetical protein [Streptomyces sp. NPDC058291]|uniref:hypothetical protein n=1 Tax=Streptomyces sp. NPDC058291 TaxID=3346427 RepID=UPI0036E281C4